MSAHGAPIPMMSEKCGPLTGEAHVPGDKSISHRSLILGAMAVGETKISGLLEGQDVLDTAKAMQAFGAEVRDLGGGNWTVNGVGVGGFARTGSGDRLWQLGYRRAPYYGGDGDLPDYRDLYR